MRFNPLVLRRVLLGTCLLYSFSLGREVAASSVVPVAINSNDIEALLLALSGGPNASHAIVWDPRALTANNTVKRSEILDVGGASGVRADSPHRHHLAQTLQT